MINKKNIFAILVLLVSIATLIHCLIIIHSKQTEINNLELLYEKYNNELKKNNQQVAYTGFMLRERFYWYNPTLKDYNMNITELTEIIDSSAIVYRFSVTSCSFCVEKEIDYYLANKDSIHHQFIVLCEDEQTYLRLSRIYMYKNLLFYLIEDDNFNMKKFNEVFPSIYFFVEKNGDIRAMILQENAKSFFKFLSNYL